MLKERILVGVIGGIIAIVLLLLGPKVISIALAFIALIGLSEIYNATGILKIQKKLCLASYLYCLAVFITLAFVPYKDFVLNIFAVAYALGLLIYAVFNHEYCGFDDVCKMFFQTMYVIFLFAHIILVRCLPYGSYLVWIIFITAWLSDTTAFTVGKLFGRNKLLPEISPKKTIEGALGGLLGSVIFNLIFVAIVGAVKDWNVNYLSIIILSLIAGVLSQLGDLVASSIKREHNIKDYSNLLPGHGGVLDRFDSVLFVAPAVYYFVFIFPVFSIL